MMQHALCLALAISPLCLFAEPPATTQEDAKPDTAMERLKAVSLAVSESKDEIAKSTTEAEAITALQAMEKRFAALKQIKSDKPEPEPDKEEFMKNVPDIQGLQKEFSQAIKKFDNVSLVSSQFTHSVRLHVYGRAMKSLTPQQVQKAIEQELELLKSSEKLLKSTVSTFEKSAGALFDPIKTDPAQRAKAQAHLERTKHLLALTASSIGYLNNALTHPWFQEAPAAK